MKKTLLRKNLKVISLAMACWGLIFIGSGIVMASHDNTIIETTYTLGIYQNKVAESKTNEIKLKDMTLEVNNPLSVDVKDYLENIQNIETSVIKALSLDTSNVNVQEAGTYTYTISYKKKKYNGTFIITAKELPKVNLTLRNLTLKKDTILDTSLSTYIVEELTDEIKNNLTLDLSNVKTNIEGTYQYSVIYNNKIYIGTIDIYTPQSSTIITQNTDKKDIDEQDNNSDTGTGTDTETSTSTNTNTDKEETMQENENS